MKARQQKKTIAVIEDIGSITKLLAIILRKAGYEVATFESGEVACQWFAENHPVLVLCDIMLPGINGEEVLDYVRSLGHMADTPVIAVTALGSPGDRERLIGHGFDEHIPKPINPGTFVPEIEKLLK